MAVRNKKITVSTIVRKAVDMAIVAVRKAEQILSTIVRKAVEMAIVAVRKAERNNIIGTPNAILQTHANTKYSTGIAKKSSKG